jgi:protein-S-isoprenylcysteine O-methyltransferase Ste14
MHPSEFRVTVSRRAAVVVWVSGVAVVHVGLPVLVAVSARRATLKAHTSVRFTGLTSLLVGLTGLTWSLAQHFEAVPEGGYKMALTPQYLLQSGPYRFSRNPMYVFELAIWTGWSMLLTNPLLGGATALFGLGLRRAVRLEETAMAARFGTAWDEYAARTPRWLGSPG